MAIPTLIVGSANPHGIANVLVTIGAVLCFALLRYVVEIPLFVCFLLAVIAWTALITGVRYIVKST